MAMKVNVEAQKNGSFDSVQNLPAKAVIVEAARRLGANQTVGQQRMMHTLLNHTGGEEHNFPDEVLVFVRLGGHHGYEKRLARRINSRVNNDENACTDKVDLYNDICLHRCACRFYIVFPNCHLHQSCLSLSTCGLN